MTHLNLLLVILGMMIGTAFCRLVPMYVLGNWSPRDSLKEVMKYIPVCVLGAMIIPSVVLYSGQKGPTIDLLRPEFLVFIPTLFIAKYTKNVGLTVVAGVVLIAIVRALTHVL